MHELLRHVFTEWVSMYNDDDDDIGYKRVHA